MKLTLLNITKSVAAIACAWSLGTNAYALTLTVGDARDLGYIGYGIPSGDQDRQNYVNYLLSMPLNSSGSALGQSFVRSGVAAAVSSVVWAANGNASGSYNVGSGGYTYLFGKYDGPNAGAEVWYIGGLTGTITIPLFGLPQQNNQYGLSGVTFFNPSTGGGGGGGASAPEAGSMIAMLGFALVGIDALRRRIVKA